MERYPRRRFVGQLTTGGAALALAGTSFTLEGCSAVGELETWVPVGLAAFDGVVQIVDAAFTAIGTTVDALWTAVQNAINLYQHSTDPTNTNLDKVIATLDALAGGLTQALAALPISIPAAVLNAAKLGLSLLIATLKSIRDKLQPATAAVVQPHTVAMRVAIANTAPAKNTKDFVSKFNAIMVANGQQVRVK